jgi:hypothetical protein
MNWIDRAAPGVILRSGKAGPGAGLFPVNVLPESVRSGFLRSGK